MASTEVAPSRFRCLAQLSRTALVTLYQSRHLHDRYEVGGWDRDQLITAILDQDRASTGWN